MPSAPHAFSVTSTTSRKRLFSLDGGKLGGCLWSLLPETTAEWWPDGHFRLASQLRLCSLQIAPGTTCCFVCSKDEEVCGKPLDLLHLLDCKVGPGRMRPDRALAQAVAKTLRVTGAEVDIERIIPELRGRPKEIRTLKRLMPSSIAFWAGCPSRFLLDVTLRSPHASRYENAAVIPGSAALASEGKKTRRYGAEVLPVAIDTYGRLGRAVDAGFQQLAAAASNCGVVRQNFAASLPSPLRIKVQLAAICAKADVALLALRLNARSFRRKYRPLTFPTRPPPSPVRTPILLPHVEGAVPAAAPVASTPPPAQPLLGESGSVDLVSPAAAFPVAASYTTAVRDSAGFKSGLCSARPATGVCRPATIPPSWCCSGPWACNGSCSAVGYRLLVSCQPVRWCRKSSGNPCLHGANYLGESPDGQLVVSPLDAGVCSPSPCGVGTPFQRSSLTSCNVTACSHSSCNTDSPPAWRPTVGLPPQQVSALPVEANGSAIVRKGPWPLYEEQLARCPWKPNLFAVRYLVISPNGKVVLRSDSELSITVRCPIQCFLLQHMQNLKSPNMGRALSLASLIVGKCTPGQQRSLHISQRQAFEVD